jgi:pilus assembly protein CpaB
MNRTRLLMIGVVALALGALVSLFVYKTLQGKSRAGNEAGVNVIVAANDIQVGSRVGENDIRIAKFPPTGLPAGAYSKRSDVLGRGVIVPISQGEFMLPSKLAPENAGAGLPSLIPPGMRAVSVRVNEVVSVAGFVGPGTRVDVLLTGTAVGSGEQQQTTTVLQNVLVIAAGNKLERSTSGESQNAPVITLLVSPDDAERLTLASSEGHIQLVLRNPLDTKQDEVASAKRNSLYKGSLAPPPPVAPHAHVAKKIEDKPAPPTVLSVQVYQGDKKAETVTFPETSQDNNK